MICTRCGGLMRIEPVKSRQEERLLLWACFACGDRTDETIWFHRQFQREETDFERRQRIERELRVAWAGV